MNNHLRGLYARSFESKCTDFLSILFPAYKNYDRKKIHKLALSNPFGNRQNQHAISLYEKQNRTNNIFIMLARCPAFNARPNTGVLCNFEIYLLVCVEKCLFRRANLSNICPNKKSLQKHIICVECLRARACKKRMMHFYICTGFVCYGDIKSPHQCDFQQLIRKININL